MIDLQVYDYFADYPFDCLFLRATVLVVLFSNTVITVATCAICYIVS